MITPKLQEMTDILRLANIEAIQNKNRVEELEETLTAVRCIIIAADKSKDASKGLRKLIGLLQEVL